MIIFNVFCGSFCEWKQYFLYFLSEGTEGNTPLRRACWKIIFNGTQTESLPIFSMQILMLSWSWALSESRF